MARRRSSDIEIFSLSFLDLISCAMGGIIVLYTIADNSNAAFRHKPTSSIIQVDMSPLTPSAEYLFLVTNTYTYEGTPARPGSWIFGKDTATLRLKEPLRPDATLTIALVDHDLSKAPIPQKYSLQYRILGPTLTRPASDISVASPVFIRTKILATDQDK